MNDVEGIATDPRQNWGAEAWRQPDIKDDEEIVYSECGRIIGRVDYRSHWFVVTRTKGSGPHFFALIVKHGGGQERITGHALRHAVPLMAALDSDGRYLFMDALYSIRREGFDSGHSAAKWEYRTAFAENRLKKRKLPRQNVYRIWIEDKV